MKLKTMFTAIVAILALAACQKPTPYMTLSDKTLQVGEDGGKVSFSISANTYYRVNNDIEWAEFVVESTVGETTTFSITVPANPKTEKRSSTVRFIGDGVTPLKFTLVQDAKTPVGVTPEKIDVAFNETSASFTVLGIKPWTASCDNPAFKLSATSGKGEAVVDVTFPENEKEQVVKAIVTVTIDAQSYTCEINQGAAPSKERIDLGANGTSNCYIVSKGGFYKFNAKVRGTGNVPESCNGVIAPSIEPVRAAILWSTFNSKTAPASQDAMITELGLEDGYVIFQTSDMVNVTPGNVIIAVYDAADVILWSWHIWLTEEPAVSEIGGSMWMDRNLGAVNNVRGDAGSCGLFYQWGRKDPLRSASSFEDGDFIATLPEPAGAEIEVPVDETNGTIAASIKNPRAFINTFPGGAGPKDWVNDKGNNDRWMDDTKTMFDPCPAGYKLPSSAQMQAFGAAGGLPTGSTKYSANADAKAAFKQADHVFETSAWSLPIAGYIAYNDGTLLTDVNACAKYVTSSRAAAPSSYFFNANTSACNFTNSATCGHAAAARCVKVK